MALSLRLGHYWLPTPVLLPPDPPPLWSPDFRLLQKWSGRSQCWKPFFQKGVSRPHAGSAREPTCGRTCECVLPSSAKDIAGTEAEGIGPGPLPALLSDSPPPTLTLPAQAQGLCVGRKESLEDPRDSGHTSLERTVAGAKAYMLRLWDVSFVLPCPGRVTSMSFQAPPQGPGTPIAQGGCGTPA